VYQKLGRNFTLSKIASNLSISIGTVFNILKQFMLTGGVAAKSLGARMGSKRLIVG